MFKPPEQRVLALFEAALDRPVAGRRAFLEVACGDDHELRAAVEALIEEDAAASDFLKSPVVARLVDPLDDGGDPWLNRTIGSYRLLEVVGRGGMSLVFRAERSDEEFEQRVALKLIRGSIDSAWARRRFRVERQILASLQHPNVARLLDGGTTEDGAPYVVMELIEGAPITRFCDDRCIGVRGRLALFREVCGAVQYAHQMLVVHRDLKPTNILVTAEGVPKLLDFGIAKLLPSAGDATEPPTEEDRRVLTRNYASPEQASSARVTTVSDVYSLGVLLYELLTGRLPQRPEGLGSPIVARAEPRRPSAAVAGDRKAAAARSTRPGSLRTRLAGDLDTIVLRALQSEPERRYQSVEQLSEDVRRHLEGRPVLARPPSLGYLAMKFVCRNVWAVAGAALVACLVFLGGIQSVRLARQRDVAERERARAEEVTRFFVESLRVADPWMGGGDTMTIREALDRAVDRVEQEGDASPELRSTLLHTAGLVYAGLDLNQPALELLRRSEALRRQTFGERAAEVAESLEAQAEVLLAQGEAEVAEERVRAALSMRLELSQGRRPSSLSEAALASCEAKLAGVLHQRADYVGGGRLYREALAIERRLFPEPSAEVGDTLNGLAQLLADSGDLEAGVTQARRALALRRAVHGTAHPAVAESLNNLATMLHRQGRLEEALSLFREALELDRQLMGNEHSAVANALNNLGSLLETVGELSEAASMYRESLGIIERRLGGEHLYAGYVLNNLAGLVQKQGRREEALQLLERALHIFRTANGDDHPNTAQVLHNEAALLREMGRPQEALPLVRRALAINQATWGPTHHSVGGNLNILAAVLRDLGRTEEAEPRCREALAIFEVRGESHPDVPLALHVLGDIRRLKGDGEEAERLYRRALDLYRQGPVGVGAPAARVMVSLADYLKSDGRSDEAGELAVEAVQVFSATLPPGHWRLEGAQRLLEELDGGK